ncbi:MAG: hypothetical protein D6748_01805 [Calditrichaeota bacterium]|nr:MAG: hypothetical protein D6748_01805 [Calditrichota bacterium]
MIENLPPQLIYHLKKQIPEFQKKIKNALKKGLEEPGTVVLVGDMFEKMWGFEKVNEIIFDLVDRNRKRDLAIKINGKLMVIAEIIKLDKKINEGFLRESKIFAQENGIPWMVSTNGILWKIYSVDYTRHPTYTLILEFDFLEIDPKNREHLYWLYLLSKDGFKQNALKRYFEYIQIVNPYTLSVLLQSDIIVNNLVDIFNKIAPTLEVDKKEILKIIVNKMLKEDLTKGKQFNKAKLHIEKLLKDIKVR